MRVVSLVPSATEILCAIDGGAMLLQGRSHECDYPPEAAAAPILTSQRTTASTSADIDRQVRETLGSNATATQASLYSLDVERLRAIEPDVILTQELCDVCSIDLQSVRAVAAELPRPPTIVTLNPRTLEDVFDDVLRVGDAVGLPAAGKELVVRLRERYWTARDYVNPYVEGAEVGFLEWMDPLFSAGHWTPQLIETAGGRHTLNPAGERSRQITPEDLLEVLPQRLIICPCGYAIQQTLNELSTLTSQRWWPMLPAVQDGLVVIVDGSAMFNRPGPRLIDAYCWLVGWLNDRPELIPRDFPWRSVRSIHGVVSDGTSGCSSVPGG